MADVSPGGTPDQGATPPAQGATQPDPEVPAPAPAVLPAGSPSTESPGFPPGSRSTELQAFPAGPRSTELLAFPAGPQPATLPGFHPVPFGGIAEAAPDAWVDPLTGRARAGWRRWLPISAVIVFLLAGSIGMLLFLGVNYGGAALAVGLVAAVIPVPLLVAAFLWLDRYEPEPVRYLAFCFAWGAAIATSVALLVNSGASYLFDKLGLPEALVAVLVAPFIEESMKAAGPILLFWRRREEWSGITDGIVYAGLSALGFAMVENVLYLGGHGYAAGAEQYGTATGLQNVFAIFIVRILFTGFAHPLFTSMTGIGLGISSRSGDWRVRWLAPIAGLLLAMMLHGTFNLLPTLSVSLSQPFIMLYGYLGFMVPFFFAVVGFAIALRGWEGRIAERILPFYVRTGWFAPPEVAALGSLGRRYSARQWAGRVAGPAGQRAMKGFQFAATQLALLRDGMQRGLHRTPLSMRRAELQEQRLLTAIVDYRSTFTGRDPQSPQAFWTGDIYQIAFPDGIVRPVSPPDEPVVPVPVRFAEPAYAAYGHGAAYPPGPNQPGYPTFGGYPPARPAYGTPPASAPTYGPPGYGTPPAGTPGYRASGQDAAGYGASGYGASGYGASSGGGSGYSGGPGYGSPSAGGSGYGASGPGSSAASGSGYGSPSGGAPSYGASGAGSSAASGSGYGSPSGGAPSYGASGHGTPATGAPGYDAPGYGTPPAYGGGVYGMPPATAPGYGAYGSEPLPDSPAAPAAPPESPQPPQRPAGHEHPWPPPPAE